MLANKYQIRIRLFTALGALIVFFSWIAQNYFQEKSHSEVLKLERDKLAIGLNEINKNIYQIYINEEESHISADSNYSGNLKFAYYAYVKYAGLLQYLGTLSSTDDENFIKKNESIFDKNQQDVELWFNNNKVDKLREFASNLSDWEKANGNNTINRYQNRIATLREVESNWNFIYLILYAIGALFFAIAYFLDYKKLINNKK